MEKISQSNQTFILVLAIVFNLACKGQSPSTTERTRIKSETTIIPYNDDNAQIADYIRNIFQDADGNLWLGTNNYGVAYFDGSDLSYFSNKEGFGGGQITGITSDSDNNIWFSTNEGVSKYDWINSRNGQKVFTNFSDQNTFEGNHFWSIFCDSQDNIWAGSGSGVYRYDGNDWTLFELFKNTGSKIIKPLSNVTVWSISEDKGGNIWFGTNGNGAIKYNGQSYTQYTMLDGLTDDAVDCILEDQKGNIWFGTRFGGVNRYDGKAFTNYTDKDSIGNNEVCEIFEDQKGNIWMSSEGYGVYRYDGKSFRNFSIDQGLGVKAVQTIYEDKEGRLWVGGGGGLFKLDGDQFINVTKCGPWR